MDLTPDKEEPRQSRRHGHPLQSLEVPAQDPRTEARHPFRVVWAPPGRTMQDCWGCDFSPLVYEEPRDRPALGAPHKSCKLGQGREVAEAAPAQRGPQLSPKGNKVCRLSSWSGPGRWWLGGCRVHSLCYRSHLHMQAELWGPLQRIPLGRRQDGEEPTRIGD